MSLPTQTSAKPSRVLLIAVCSAFLVGLDSMITVPLVPAIAEDTGTAARLGGLFVSAYALLFALSAPLCGAMSDRIGRRTILTTGLVTFALGNILTGVTSDFVPLLVCRGVAGLGAAMIMPSVYAMIADSFPFERRGKVMGIVVAGLLSSTVIGVPLGSYLAYLMGWRAAFFAVGAVAVLVCALVFALIGATPPRAAAGQQSAASPVALYLGMVKRAVTTPAVLCVLGCTLLWAFALYGMFSNIGIFYAERFDFNEAQTGLAIMGSGAGSMTGALLGGRIADRLGKRTVLVAAALVAATGVTSVALIGEHLVPVLIVFVMWGTAVGVGQPSLNALVSELRPEMRGTALALNSSAQYGGMMLATSVAAVLLDNGVSFSVIGAICGVCALAVLPLLVGVRVAGKAEAAEAPAPGMEAKA
ncbi:MFS transporter [Streptomyces cyaneochromogenes]|uniref:MFS transporter n=2 Tax=Streptomyces cyaneochromogenes TaxID=2496836 RepID=A0A3Q9ETY2_9ACTN|nr:MFS transporter [Streptomyces cyaneochromogenes]AZQ38781.1 MFS transporter [Streptomyces cyaneochromogenes]